MWNHRSVTISISWLVPKGAPNLPEEVKPEDWKEEELISPATQPKSTGALLGTETLRGKTPWVPWGPAPLGGHTHSPGPDA